jgi:REP element-mobilizing transposase RayT
MPIETLDQHNHSIRPDNYDYSQSGAYFITITTLESKPIFGEIQDNKILLNKLGEIAYKEWERLTRRYYHIELGAFVIMPNHMHGIILIKGKKSGQTAVQKSKLYPSHFPKSEDLGTTVIGSIPTIIRSYKSSVSLRGRSILGKGNKTIWQGGYYEQIILDIEDMERITGNIEANPSNWEKDVLTGNLDY